MAIIKKSLIGSSSFSKSPKTKSEASAPVAEKLKTTSANKLNTTSANKLNTTSANKLNTTSANKMTTTSVKKGLPGMGIF